MDVYEQCPVLENDGFLLRLVEERDCEDLLKVYSDEKAVPLFNSDNCNGDDFHYTTSDRMKKAIDFWLFSFQNRYFVRWSIINKATEKAVGTVELFRREADDAFTDTALLRLDLRSDFEKEDCLFSLLSLLLKPACELFACSTITTKAVPQAVVRRQILAGLGFEESIRKLKGHSGQEYGSYFVYRKYA